MYRRFHDRFGTAGLVIAVIALVAALGVPAVAAPVATTSASLAKKVAKALGLAGKANKRSIQAIKIARNASGTPGPQGPAGAQGLKGDKGEQGIQGVKGDEGSPWTAGGTLPSGESETGNWAMGDGSAGEGAFVDTAISFTIPLAAPLENEETFCEPATELCQVQAKEVGYDGSEEETVEEEQCPGNVEEPKAAPGFLCLYTAAEEGITTFETLGRFLFINKSTAASPLEEGADTSGAVIRAASLESTAGAELHARGTWAVTAP